MNLLPSALTGSLFLSLFLRSDWNIRANMHQASASWKLFVDFVEMEMVCNVPAGTLMH